MVGPELERAGMFNNWSRYLTQVRVQFHSKGTQEPEYLMTQQYNMYTMYIYKHNQVV